MAGFGFGQNFGQMGELTAYPEVRAFEDIFNTVWRTSQVLPAGDRIPGSTITVDAGLYGSEVDGALQRYITFLVRQGECTDVTAAEVRSIGPNAVRACLVRTGMTREMVGVLQRARDEWKRAARPEPGGGSIDPYAAARIDCATTGGTWNTGTNTCTPAGEKEGMGAGTWIALLLLGGLGAYGVYYVSTNK